MLRDAIFEKLRSSKISKHILSDSLESIFIDLLFPKGLVTSATGIIYKSLSQTRFLEQIITEIEALELKNELYFFLETLRMTWKLTI